MITESEPLNWRRSNKMPNDKRWKLLTAKGQLKMAEACVSNASANLTGLRKEHVIDYAERCKEYIKAISEIIDEELELLKKK